MIWSTLQIHGSYSTKHYYKGPCFSTVFQSIVKHVHYIPYFCQENIRKLGYNTSSMCCFNCIICSLSSHPWAVKGKESERIALLVPHPFPNNRRMEGKGFSKFQEGKMKPKASKASHTVIERYWRKKGWTRWILGASHKS